MPTAYAIKLGNRLRAVRNAQGLSLGDVEKRSKGAWKAVVVGSYERAQRGVAVPKLAELAEFYGVPVTDLLPAEDAERGDGVGALAEVITASGVTDDVQAQRTARFVVDAIDAGKLPLRRTGRRRAAARAVA